MKRRLTTLLLVICLVALLVPMTVSAAENNSYWHKDGDYWYYVYNGSFLKDCVFQIGGQYYGFDGEGRMYSGTSFSIESYNADGYYTGENYYRAREDGTLYANAWAEIYEDCWYYYGAGGKAVEDFQQIGGTWYFFDYDGEMLTDRAVWSNSYEAYYALSADGKAHSKLAASGWQKHFGSWYFTENGHPVEGQLKAITGKWYAFEWNGKMVCDGISDTYVWDPDTYENYRVIADKNGYVIPNGWYQSSEGDWYYAKNWKAIDYGRHVLEGKEYFFEDGKLLINDWAYWYDETTGTYYNAHTNSNGEIIKNGWYQDEYGSWYYAKNYNRLSDGVYNISGDWFLFDWDGELYTELGRVWFDGNYYYVTNTNGNLLINQWNYDKAESAWYYYGSNGAGAEGLQAIGGKWYYFSSGRMLTQSIQQTASGVFVFDKDGVGKKVTGWFETPYDEPTWRFAEGNRYLRDEIRTINGTQYAFDWDGNMVVNGTHWDDESLYLFDANGKGITKAGWHQVDGAWYLVENNKAAATGWKAVAGKWYFFNENNGQMYHDTLAYSYADKAWFYHNASGVASKLTGTGWKSVSFGRIYLKNGVPAQNKWEYIDGAWYYFYFDGEPYYNGNYEIDGAIYGFDANGKMRSGGWFGNSFYYGDGKAATGLTTINGVKYFFSGDGYLQGTGLYSADGATYYVTDGVVKATVTKGWNFIGGKWYYAHEDVYDWYSADYYLATGREYINGKYYLFDNNGVLLTNGLYCVDYDWFITDADGCPKSGWQYYGGKWYYAEEPDGWLRNGYTWINENGKDNYYVFKDCVLQIGTFAYNNHIYTTDSSGRVIKETPMPDGWTYSEDANTYIYMKNGAPYNGWVGEYYVQYGEMLFNEEVSYNGARYYLGKDGRYLKSGWFKKTYGEWIYAKAGGELCCNEWLYTGGIWYYFEGTRMVTYDTYIDGVLHSFNADGKWLGEIKDSSTTMPTMADGWQYINKKWYYYHADKPVSGRHYIDGAWYCFGNAYYYEYLNESDRYMIAGNVDSNGWEGKVFYYGADGKRANYTGWKMIGNHWYFFNADHSLATGLQKINGAYYYFERIGLYDDEGNAKPMSGAPAMVKNCGFVIDDELYLFGADGSCKAPTTKNGWHTIGGNWYYVRNGKAVRDGTATIDGKTYYFYYDGMMATDDWCEINTGNRWEYVYFGKDGAQVTKSGWYKLDWDDETRWIFVGADGYLYRDGIYRIGGKDYSFYSVWLVE